MIQQNTDILPKVSHNEYIIQNPMKYIFLEKGSSQTPNRELTGFYTILEATELK